MNKPFDCFDDFILECRWNEGKTLREIAAELEHPQSSVKARRRKLGLPPRRNPAIPLRKTA